MKKQEFKYTLLTEIDDQIVYATYVPKLEITLEIAHELVRNRVEFSQDEPHYVVIDFTNVRSVTKEARDYMNRLDGGLKGILGGAFLSNNVVATLFINLYLKVNNPAIPARYFTSRGEAVKWLNKIKSEKPQLV
jgi:hypothetical protein